MEYQEENDITLENLISIEIKDEYTDSVKKFLVEIRKRNREENSTLNILLSQARKTVRSIVSDKNNMTHMICFPKFWFKKWNNNRKVLVILKDQIVFVHSVEETKEKLYNVGGTHYIRLKNNIYSALGYPKELQMEYFETYLTLTVTEREKEKIRLRKPEIELRKLNETMKQTYARAL